MRFILLLAVPSLLLALVACGGDDDDSPTNGPTDPPIGSSDPSPSGDPLASDGPSGTPAPTATPEPSPTPVPTPTPTRRPVAADRYGRLVIEDLAGFLSVTFQGAVPVPVVCPFDAVNVVIDCTAQGFGTIALDTTPTGVVVECRALLHEGAMVAVSCTTDVPSGWIYRLDEGNA